MKILQRINEPKSWSFAGLNNVDTTLARRKKKDQHQWNEQWKGWNHHRHQ